ncbi:MAG: hypothetical protein ACSLE1_18825 [Sphingobium sp.]
MIKPPILRTLLKILLLASMAEPAVAGPLPPIAFVAMGYKEVTLQSLSPGKYSALRAADPSGFLSVTADFNGDGNDDEARILANPERGDARVVIVIQSPDKVDTYVLYSVPIADVDKLGIQLSAAETGLPGLIVFHYDGVSAELNVLKDGEFEVTPITRAAPTPDVKLS